MPAMREALPLALSGIFDQGNPSVVSCTHGTGWEADDRQGNEARRGDAAHSFHLQRDMNPKLSVPAC
jgi:hypothetical protein